MLKTKMHRPTSEIITSMAAASGSRTNPSCSVCSPNVNHVKFWTARKPCVCSVGRNATIEIASTTIWPPIASTAALLRRDSKEHYGINWSGVLIALAVFAGLTWAVLKTPSLSIVPPHIHALTVKQIGQALMTGYVWPLQCVGLLLTAALIGALVLVMEEKR